MLPSRAILAFLCLAPALRGADLPSDLNLVPRDGPGFVSVRVGELVNSKMGEQLLVRLGKNTAPLLKDIERELGVPLGDIERVTVLMGEVIIIRTTKPFDRAKVMQTLAPGGKETKVKNGALFGGGNGTGVLVVDDRVFAKGRAQALAQLAERPPAKADKDALSAALALANGKHHVVAALQPAQLLLWTMPQSMPEAPAAIEQAVPIRPGAPGGPGGEGGTRDGPPPPPPQPAQGRPKMPDLKELLDELPPEALPYKPLFQARLITLTLDVGEETKVQARLTFADKNVMADAENSLRTALYVAREFIPRAAEEMVLEPEVEKKVLGLLGELRASLRATVIRQEGTALLAEASLKIDPVLVGEAVAQVRGSAEQIRSANNLKQIGLAFLNFESANGVFPPATIFSKDGKPLLSWRVAILPYIEANDLYAQFKLDEPWDGPNNKKLLAKMPAIYAPVKGTTKEPHSTYYRVFTGPETPFANIPDGSAPFGCRGPRIASITDGTSNTFLAVEAGEAVPWTKPDEIAVVPGQPVPKLGGQFGTAFHVVYFDGSARFIKNDIDKQLLRWLITPAGGEVIGEVPEVGARVKRRDRNRRIEIPEPGQAPTTQIKPTKP